jgi:short-chain Z-isoprenyl diphosphate synthase
VGALHLLHAADEKELLAIRERTAHVAARTFNVAVAYNGREEIVEAVRGLLAERGLDTPITAKDIAAHLYTAGQPDIDLVIRTSGEQRLSTFMPWQTTYAELHFPPIAWPDFTRADFDEAVTLYRRRHRRFGG